MKLSSQQLNELLRDRPALRKRNPEISGAPGPEPLRPGEPEPVKRRALVSRVPREEKSGPRFEVCFTVFSVRPCDWDGYHIKPLLDMVVHAGILPGDAWHQLDGRVRSRKVSTAEEEKTLIEICRISD